MLPGQVAADYLDPNSNVCLARFVLRNFKYHKKLKFIFTASPSNTAQRSSDGYYNFLN